MKRNSFITAALEELQQSTDVNSAEPSVATVTLAVDGAGVSNAANAPPVTEVSNIAPDDAVAELMEKNSTLEDTNASLETEVFDNDVDTIEGASDSVQEDLNEAVAAGAALEELAYVCSFAVRTGQANKAAVAGYAMALEQLAYRAGLQNPIPGLESEAGDTPEQQAKSIGESAMGKAKEIGKRLAAAIKRIIGMIINMIRNFMAKSAQLAERAKKAMALVDSIDESKKITSEAFIASLRLIEGAGDVNEQFEQYARTASLSLYGYFNEGFAKNMIEVFDQHGSGAKDDAYNESGVRQRLHAVLDEVMKTVYTTEGKAADSDAPKHDDETMKHYKVGLTTPCIGGGQLYLAYFEFGDNKASSCKAGLSRNQPKFETPSEIPVASKHTAKFMLQVIQKWMEDQKKLQGNLFKIEAAGNRASETSSEAVQEYLAVLTALTLSTIPNFLRMNLHNSASFIAYVEKSISISKGAPETAEAK